MKHRYTVHLTGGNLTCDTKEQAVRQARNLATSAYDVHRKLGKSHKDAKLAASVWITRDDGESL